ncbi:putative uncharacterized protein DDB_G0283051 [Protopterus annectens]|uniref:putative uncharacterized protein DDB_G0283051 n=1 Tax=Protopterus annectens TaxID=7888 RepID=UPI001CFA2E72|nr:putative uncharacterized protein DDB_G0283051 [Protopterus annectens]
MINFQEYKRLGTICVDELDKAWYNQAKALVLSLSFCPNKGFIVLTGLLIEDCICFFYCSSWDLLLLCVTLQLKAVQRWYLLVEFSSNITNHNNSNSSSQQNSSNNITSNSNNQQGFPRSRNDQQRNMRLNRNQVNTRNRRNQRRR